MNKRLLSIIIAVVFALLAVVMIRAYLTRERQRYQVQLQETYVVVATVDIPAGATILPNMVRPINFPAQYAQPRVLQNPNAAVGKIAAAEISKGEQILETKLTTVRKTDDSLAVRLPQGKRAFTFTIDSLSAVAGQIRTGDFIDIIGSFPYAQVIEGKQITENISVTLFQNVLVMGVKSGDGGKLIFTLALTPQESAILSYALGQGALRLILRHPLDTAVDAVTPIEINALWQYILSTLGQQLVQPKAEDQQRVEPPPPPTLEIYKGAKKESMEINK